MKRFWCRFICPIGNLYGHFGNRHSLLTVNVAAPERCLGCNICSMACPMSIDLLHYIRQGRSVDDYRCFRCGRCVEVCPHHVLSLGLRGGSRKATPGFMQRPGAERLHTNTPGEAKHPK